MEKFLEKLQQKYDLDDFTGYLGTFLDLDYDLYKKSENETDYQVIMDSCMQFLQDVYNIACECQ